MHGCSLAQTSSLPPPSAAATVKSTATTFGLGISMVFSDP